MRKERETNQRQTFNRQTPQFSQHYALLLDTFTSCGVFILASKTMFAKSLAMSKVADGRAALNAAF